MKICLLIICIAGLVVADLRNRGEAVHSVHNRGLHFFRLRRSPQCVEIEPEIIQQILIHGVCPFGDRTPSFYDEN
uniref:Secreted protein n=1 Tax=Mesocestoides corti TaxID=53468 RepID=A0A5K3F3X4_MESCO